MVSFEQEGDMILAWWKVPDITVLYGFSYSQSTCAEGAGEVQGLEYSDWNIQSRNGALTQSYQPLRMTLTGVHPIMSTPKDDLDWCPTNHANDLHLFSRVRAIIIALTLE